MDNPRDAKGTEQEQIPAAFARAHLFVQKEATFAEVTTIGADGSAAAHDDRVPRVRLVHHTRAAADPSSDYAVAQGLPDLG